MTYTFIRPADFDPLADVLMPGLHMAEAVSTLPVPLPLCWVADGKQRGATDDEWAISYDHDAIPAVWVVDDPTKVACPECLAWTHA